MPLLLPILRKDLNRENIKGLLTNFSDMKTKLYKCTDSLDEVAYILKNGGLVAFPTETVYGLGANALDESAAMRIYAAKGRPSDNPLIVHLSSPEEASEYAYTGREFMVLAERFMPGPITVILKKRAMIPDTVTGGLDTVAIRVPSNSVARELISKAGVPVAAPSANLSGRPSCTEFSHVVEDMNGRVDAIIDGGECEIGLESTIVKIVGDMTLKLLRPGAVTYTMLVEAGFTVTLDKAVTEKLSDNERPDAPGMKYKHYAPKAQVILLDGDASRVTDFLYEKSHEEGIGVVLFENERRFAGENAVFIGEEGNPKEQAKRLFAILREFDMHSEIKTVYARVPCKEGLGLAIYNRMLKASGYTVISL